VLGMTAMITFPAMIYLTFGLSYPVSELLSPHWREVLPLIAILAPAGAAQSIAAYSGPILLARGEARLQFWISSANSAAMILAFVVALPFGLTAVAVVYTVVAIIVCVVMLIVGTRRAGLPFASVAKALFPASVATCAAATAALLAVSGEVTTLRHWLLATTLYATVVLACYVVFRRHIRGSLRSLLGGPMASPAVLESRPAS
jgi:O-antigen/teichoic acid export membrane protein